MDFRYAWRRLGAAPGFTIVATLTLALGISATTAIYSVVDALLLRPLPYKDADNLRQALHVHPGGNLGFSLPYDKLVEWRGHADLFEQVEHYNRLAMSIAGAGEPELIFGAEVGGGLMAMFGVGPQLGRAIQEEDAQPGRDDVVVISDSLWRTRFGADPEVLGRPLRLDDKVFEIIGVMNPALRFPMDRTQFWTPAPLAAQRNGRPSSYNAIVRLRSGIGVEQSQKQADVIAGALAIDKPLEAGWAISLRPLRGMNPRERYALYVLFGAVALVLLIACANLANLLLVQGASRNREVAVRAALGASRRRLVRQLLTETMLLATMGGALGLLLSWQAVSLLAAYTPRDLTFLNANLITLDWRVVAFAIALTFLTAAGFGLVPALRTSRTVLHDALKAGVRNATGTPRQERVRRVFVVAQLALSLVLLVGAGLLTRTVAHIVHVDPGLDAEDLVTASLSLPSWKYRGAQVQQEFYEQVLERLRALPGVKAAILAGGAPPTGGGISFGLQFEIDGRGVVLDDPSLIMPIANVRPEHFAVLGIPLRAGRTFTELDSDVEPRPIVIGETMASQLWKGENPLGQRIRFSPKRPWYTVIGVAGDVYQFEHEKPTGLFALYYPLPMNKGLGSQLTLIVRTTTDAAAMIPAIKQQIWSVDPDQPIVSIATLESRYADFFETPRFYAFLTGAFAILGLVIAAVGLYGTLAYAMAQRTREFGIRMALGAEPADVLRMVLRTGGGLVAAGLILGVGGSLLLTRWIEALLVEVPRTDLVTYATVMLALGSIGILAAWLPARRATGVDPVVALRTD
jgi:putative ABC transport system permease protein